MLSHLSFGVADLARTTVFYDAVMAALGHSRVWTSDKGVGYGPNAREEKLTLFLTPGPVQPPGPGFHLAFAAPGRDAVDRFHAAALAHGGADHGAPGLRLNYSPTYYAAFVIDPDGYKLEAVFQ
ncbi:VOC family protein [Phreatobacter stygius]|uniref:VOC family protein n=1 Tax=Phreatobacter stygius TaxID=1940610 RepID=A0A4D7BGS1_9HYPH|nr:VOC family protein [Phreatobacter stygius]QCI68356.1 VOC family protein [Phreatobacter stygius]